MEDTRCIQKGNALTLLVQMAYAMVAASESSCLDSCVRMHGAVTGIVRMPVAASERSCLDGCVRTRGAVTGIIRMLFAMTFCVWKICTASRRQMP